MKKQVSHNTLLSLAQLGEIQKHLPRGSQKTIAIKYEVSEAYVSLVLKGLRSNEYILEDAIAMAKEGKKNMESRRQQLQRKIKCLSK